MSKRDKLPYPYDELPNPQEKALFGCLVGIVIKALLALVQLAFQHPKQALVLVAIAGAVSLAYWVDDQAEQTRLREAASPSVGYICASPDVHPSPANTDHTLTADTDHLLNTSGDDPGSGTQASGHGAY